MHTTCDNSRLNCCTRLVAGVTRRRLLLVSQALVRLKLVEPVTAAAFNIMCEDIDDSSLDDEAAEANTAAQFAVQVLKAPNVFIHPRWN